jgi:hypothetical protein
MDVRVCVQTVLSALYVEHSHDTHGRRMRVQWLSASKAVTPPDAANDTGDCSGTIGQAPRLW